MSTQKKYPIDIRSFPRIREEGYVYVDKTQYVYDLVNNGATYPSYIIESLKKAKVQPSQLERMVATAQDFDAPIEEMSFISLLYQSGYLTITGYNEVSDTYILEIPNKEVRLGLMHSLIPNYVEQPA